MPIGAAAFDEALTMAARIYRAAGEIMADHGRLRGVADEGGWWPEFASNAEALDTLVAAIERAALVPGEEVGIAIDVAASQFYSGGCYRLAADGAELETEALIELLAGWCRRYPILSIEDPVAEDDDTGMVSFTAKRQPDPDHRGRLSRDFGAARGCGHLPADDALAARGRSGPISHRVRDGTGAAGEGLSCLGGDGADETSRKPSCVASRYESMKRDS
jgi:hypothetical protein